MSPVGHSRRFDHVRDESGLPPIPDLLRHRNKGDAYLMRPILKNFSREIEARIFTGSKSKRGGGGRDGGLDTLSRARVLPSGAGCVPAALACDAGFNAPLKSLQTPDRRGGRAERECSDLRCPAKTA